MRLAIVAGLAITTSLMALDKEPAKRLGEAAAVFSEVMATPDKGIPQDLLDKAHCIVIVPSLKTGGIRSRREIRQRTTCRAGTAAAKAGRRPPRCASRAAALAFRLADL